MWPGPVAGLVISGCHAAISHFGDRRRWSEPVIGVRSTGHWRLQRRQDLFAIGCVRTHAFCVVCVRVSACVVCLSVCLSRSVCVSVCPSVHVNLSAPVFWSKPKWSNRNCGRDSNRRGAIIIAIANRNNRRGRGPLRSGPVIGTISAVIGRALGRRTDRWSDAVGRAGRRHPACGDRPCDRPVNAERGAWTLRRRWAASPGLAAASGPGH